MSVHPNTRLSTLSSMRHRAVPAIALAALCTPLPVLAQSAPTVQIGADATRPASPHDQARPPVRAAGGVKVRVIPPALQSQAEEASRGEDKMADPIHWTDWIQAISNVCLLIANGALLVVTNRSAKAAQKAAEAALRQAEIMGAAEAPVVRVFNIQIGGQGPLGRQGRPQIPDGPFLIVDLVNRGRSSASIVAFGFDKVVQRDAPAEVVEAQARDIQADIFLLPQDSFPLQEPFDLSGGERQRMLEAVERLWIWGFVDFQDGLGRVRRQRFFVKTMIDANQDNTLFRFQNLKPPRSIG